MYLQNSQLDRQIEFGSPFAYFADTLPTAERIFLLLVGR
jgi:hypothetical protein